ncbi:MAG: DNA polymerase III subunit [Candidatus Nealsonbacteria bacterium]|nr:DNA polymerase III subunit [Candidatus Nealsonbacteria bacterium]
MIIGHKKQRDLFTKMIANNRIPHALLFSGYEKIGKRSIAINLAKSLICENVNGPCMNCNACLLSEKGVHPDLIIVSSLKKEIIIDQIRELSRQLSFKPYSSSVKVAIIDDAHLMNQQAQNSLLKLLEEPGDSSVIILVSDHPEILLPTIRSRVQIVKFFPVDKNEIRSHLKSANCQEDLIEGIVSFSFGKPGVALDLLFDPGKIEVRRKKVNELINIISPESRFHLRFDYVKKISEDPELVGILNIWLSYFRALFLEKIKGNKKVVYSVDRLRNILLEIEESIYLLSKTNVNNKMVLENLIMEL